MVPSATSARPRDSNRHPYTDANPYPDPNPHGDSNRYPNAGSRGDTHRHTDPHPAAYSPAAGPDQRLGSRRDRR